MGRLIYDSTGVGAEIDDRTLAHLRVAIMIKLRRAESFMLEVELHDGAGGRRCLWIHPAVPLVFHFFGTRPARINPAWVDELLLAASGPNGLTVLPEPLAPTDASQ